MQLRPYQEKAVASLWRYFEEGNTGHPLISMAVGTGKSLVMAKLAQDIMQYPNTTIAVIAPSQILVEQNYNELKRLWPKAPAGIYCAGLGRKDTHYPIIFGTIQSMYRAKSKLPTIEIGIVDESHGIPHSQEGMWRTYINEQKARNPDLRIIGLSGSPYRMSTGRLDEGKDKLFDKVVFEYSLKDGIDEGYLSPLITKDTKQHFDLSGVRTRSGDYAQDDLQKAVNKDDINRAVVKESINLAGNRKGWLFFCTGIEHSEEIARILREEGIKAVSITSKDSDEFCKKSIEEFRRGEIQALASVSMLDTGFNVPMISFIADVCPTKSPGRLVQRYGRGARKAEGKENCLIADYSSNLLFHGVIDKIDGRRKPKGKGEAPIRICEECATINHAAARKCIDCGFEFPRNDIAKFSSKASTAPILSSDNVIHEPQTLQVDSVSYGLHVKEGRPDSMRVTYSCGLLRISEWIHFQINISRGERWWKSRSSYPLPKTAKQALVFSKSLKTPSAIIVKQNGKYLNVENYLWNNVSYVQEKQTGTAGVFREALTGQRNI